MRHQTVAELRGSEELPGGQNQRTALPEGDGQQNVLAEAEARVRSERCDQRQIRTKGDPCHSGRFQEGGLLQAAGQTEGLLVDPSGYQQIGHTCWTIIVNKKIAFRVFTFFVFMTSMLF